MIFRRSAFIGIYIQSIDYELSHALEDRAKEVALKSYETGLRHYPQLIDPSDSMRATIAVFWYSGKAKTWPCVVLFLETLRTKETWSA